MNSIIIKLIFLIAVLIVWNPLVTLGFEHPILLQDFEINKHTKVGAVELFFRTKYIKGPMNYSKNLLLYGFRSFWGVLQDPKFGFYLLRGSDYYSSPNFEINQIALTLENLFNPQIYNRLKWRVNFGGGKYKFFTSLTKFTIDEKSFTFLEPCISYVFPITRHIILEKTIGYTFTNGYNTRIEGLIIEVGLSIGRF